MKNIYFLFAASIILIIATSGIQSGNGKAGKNKAPGETSCVSCHNDFSENTGGGAITLSSDIPLSGYVAGTTYHLQVTVSKSGTGLFGFGLEALKTDSNNAGTLVITNSTITQLKNVTVLGKPRSNVVHVTDGGLSADSAVFPFDWTAPASGTGTVTFYFAGAACDNDGDTPGDYVYYSSTQANENAVGIIGHSFTGKSVSVFPNPVESDFSVNFSADENSTVTFSLFDLNGRFVAELSKKTYSGGSQSERFSLPKGTDKGMYFLTIESNDETTVQKICVL